ncbi:LysR family transcriptional regulator [Paraburkholderia kururiensis]|uniref:LysR family transcriptional regulator n=1 Tax=Paraburkholderia kururiensis TaxID=984307 RepID=UPI000373B98A|nr:LysR family transcriptional regulator [Paraburkholderia kururiensis]
METLSWDDLRVLLAIHRAGSLLAAGKAIGLSTSTIARRLDALETATGRQLVHRSQSGAELNAEALRLVRLAEGLEHGLDALRRDQTMLAGTLRVSVPDGMAPALARALLAFRHQHPGVDLELVGENQMADVAAREADIAVRLARSTSSVLVEKRLGTLRFGLFGSADYVRRHLPTGRLDTNDASLHSFIGLDVQWRDLPHEQWLRALGAARFVFRSSSMEAIAEAAHRGAGFAAFVTSDPRTAGLVAVQTTIAAPSQPCYLVYHRDLRAQPHVRAAVASIASYFAQYAQP